MLSHLLACFVLSRQFHDYKPQSVTIRSIDRWLRQFDRKDWRDLLRLLRAITYLSEEETERALVDLNSKLLERLSAQGIPLDKVVYVQVDDAGSSSAVMLNKLKTGARLECERCHFLDSKNVRELNETTNKLEEGAIIYVDDFSGTGNQFCRSRVID